MILNGSCSNKSLLFCVYHDKFVINSSPKLEILLSYYFHSPLLIPKKETQIH